MFVHGALNCGDHFVIKSVSSTYTLPMHVVHGHSVFAAIHNVWLLFTEDTKKENQFYSCVYGGVPYQFIIITFVSGV